MPSGHSGDSVVPYPSPLPVTLDSVVRLLRKTVFDLPFVMISFMTLKTGLQLAIPQMKGDISTRVIRSAALSLGFQLGMPGLRETPLVQSVLSWASIYLDATMCIGVARWCSRCYNNQWNPLGKRERIVWKDQIVVVTGGASGVGALLVRTLDKLGAVVIVLDINECEDAPDSVWSYVCDVSDYDEVMDAARHIRELVGNPTMLINNAGVVSGKLMLDLEEDDVRRTFGVNTMSHFWTIKAFLPGMLEAGKGHIVTAASVLGLAGSAQMIDYCASKAALITMHDALRFELNNRYHAPGIRTTLLLPGHIRTPLFDKIQFPRSLFFRFMAPSLEPGEVVQKIVRALAAQESRVVRMPFYTHSARLLHTGSGLVPGWARDFLQWLSQADFAMECYNQPRAE